MCDGRSFRLYARSIHCGQSAGIPGPLTYRIAITGDNGTGKSTLLNFIVPRINLAPGQIVNIPQETGPVPDSARIFRPRAVRIPLKKSLT